MALTDRGKELAMSVGIASATRYISLHLAAGTELSGHGYARKAVAASEMTVASGSARYHGVCADRRVYRERRERTGR